MKKVKLYTVSEQIIYVCDQQDYIQHYSHCSDVAQIEDSNEFVIVKNKVKVSSTSIDMMRYVDGAGKEVVTYYSMHPDVSKLLQIDRMKSTNSKLRYDYLEKSKQLDETIATNKRLDEIILDLNSRLDSYESEYNALLLQNSLLEDNVNKLSNTVAEYNLQKLKFSRLKWWQRLLFVFSNKLHD